MFIDISDLAVVISTLVSNDFPVDKWKELGLKLHIIQPLLDVIGADYPHDAETCLIECIAHWLRWNYDVDEYGIPSLEKLAAAVKDMGLRDEADKIIPGKD